MSRKRGSSPKVQITENGDGTLNLSVEVTNLVVRHNPVFKNYTLYTCARLKPGIKIKCDGVMRPVVLSLAAIAPVSDLEAEHLKHRDALRRFQQNSPTLL